MALKPRGPDIPEWSPSFSVRNLSYTLSPQEFHDIITHFGEIALEDTTRIRDRGVAYVTYYDVRCTVRACDYLTSHKIQNRFGKTGYLAQTPIDPSTGRPLSRRVSLEPMKDRQIRVSFDRMYAVLSQFGEIDKLMDLDHNRFCVDFFDIRAQFRCVDASGFIVVDDIPFQARVPNTQGQSEKSTPIRSTPDRSLSRINSGPVPSNDAGKEPTPLQRSRSRDGVLREPKMTSSVRYSFTKPQTQIVRDVPKEGVEAVLKLAEKLK